MPVKLLRDYRLDEATGLVNAAQLPEAPANALFMKGDHWQGGAGWVGPAPADRDVNAVAVMAEIKKGFTSRNATAEVVHRHTQGVVGREPNWGFTPQRDIPDGQEPTAQEQALMQEADALLTTWWDKRGVHNKVSAAVRQSLHQGRGLLRIFVPRGLLTKRESDGAQVASAPSVEEALRMIYVDSPKPTEAVVTHDPENMEQVAVHMYERDGYRMVDVSYVDGDQTVTRTLGQGQEQEFKYSMGARLPMHQLTRDLLITQQVQEQQRALNLAYSMLPRNVVTGGFLERIILNAQMPGSFVDDPTMPSGKRFVPAPYQTGPGTTNFLAGQRVIDKEGGESIATPSVHFRPPVDPEPTVKAADTHYRAILDEVDQAHHLISADATASGASRVEARLDFFHSLRDTQTPLEEMGRWLLEAVLALAEAIAGQPGQYTGTLRAEFTCRLQAGSLTADEQEALLARVDKGLTPKEDAMHLLGTDDVDAAIARIAAEPGSQLDKRAKQAEVFQSWVDAGVGYPAAALLAGFEKDSEEYKLLTTIDPTQGQVTEQ